MLDDFYCKMMEKNCQFDSKSVYLPLNSGNKFDCGSERVVKRDDGQRLANEYKVPFMETSAKTGLNVELAFHAVAR